MIRRGYSLIELLVVMSMTGTVLVIGMGVVHRVIHEQESADRDNAVHRVAERLSTKLREDVHLANHAELIAAADEGESRLVLSQPGERAVTYAVRGNLLERASIREGEPVHRDSFRFPDNCRVQFLDISAQRVTFTVFAFPQAYFAAAHGTSTAEDLESDARRAVMRVEATVGRDHRFSRGTRRPSGP